MYVTLILVGKAYKFVVTYALANALLLGRYYFSAHCKVIFALCCFLSLFISLLSADHLRVCLINIINIYYVSLYFRLSFIHYLHPSVHVVLWDQAHN